MLSMIDHTWSSNFESLYSIHSFGEKKSPKYQITADEIAKYLAFYG